MARPSSYTAEQAVAICSRLACGEALTKICADESMPDVSTVYRWLAADDEFRDMYARAREDQADTLADDVLRIADEDPGLVMRDEEGGGTTVLLDGAAIQHQKLRIDARKWVASKLKPKKYGDKLTQEHTGEGGGPVKHTVGVEFVSSPPTSV